MNKAGSYVGKQRSRRKVLGALAQLRQHARIVRGLRPGLHQYFADASRASAARSLQNANDRYVSHRQTGRLETAGTPEREILDAVVQWFCALDHSRAFRSAVRPTVSVRLPANTDGEAMTDANIVDIWRGSPLLHVSKSRREKDHGVGSLFSLKLLLTIGLMAFLGGCISTRGGDYDTPEFVGDSRPFGR
jgi:hypothetical protein